MRFLTSLEKEVNMIGHFDMRGLDKAVKGLGMEPYPLPVQVIRYAATKNRSKIVIHSP